MSYFRVNSRCTGCKSCVHNCPANALIVKYKDGNQIILHNIIACARCGNCWRICPENAVEFEHLLNGEWDEVTRSKILTCSICGRPIFSENHKTILKEKHNQEVEMLCPYHKRSFRAELWVKAEKVEAPTGG